MQGCRNWQVPTTGGRCCGCIGSAVVVCFVGSWSVHRGLACLLFSKINRVRNGRPAFCCWLLVFVVVVVVVVVLCCCVFVKVDVWCCSLFCFKLCFLRLSSLSYVRSSCLPRFRIPLSECSNNDNQQQQQGLHMTDRLLHNRYQANTTPSRKSPTRSLASK